MKKECMLYVRNAGDAKQALTENKHLEFIKKCEAYIGLLKVTSPAGKVGITRILQAEFMNEF